MPRRRFLDWTQPLPQSFAAWFWQQAPSHQSDFSDWVLIVPTAESGRKLRSHLVHSMPEERSGFLSPRIQTPPQWLRNRIANPSLANRNDCLLAWAKSLQQAAPEVHECLFRFSETQQRPERSWTLKTAQVLLRLKSVLAEGNHDFASVSRLQPEENDRWLALATLEQNYRHLLQAEGLQDPDDALTRAANQASPPDPSNRILLVGLPDPIPLLIHCLESSSGVLKPEILIAAPESLQEAFDAWGRPKPTYWTQQRIPNADLDGRVHAAADSRHSLQILKSLITQIANPQESLSIGLGEMELSTRIQDELEQLQLTVHDPQGIAARQTNIPLLLNTWREWTRSDDFQTLQRLVGFPDIERRYGGPNTRLRRDLDRLSSKYLPATLSGLQALNVTKDFNDLMHCIQHLRQDRQGLRAGNAFSKSLQSWLQSLWEGVEWDAQTDSLRVALLPVMRSWLKEWEQSAFSQEATAEEALQLLESHLLSTRCYPPRPELSVDLNGWLELLWDNRHCLCFVHFNEGLVPQSVSHDPFLPDSLREQLGLPCNEQRFARDAYQFRFLIESRRKNGRCDWIVGRHNLSGDPLKPSRLLFLCESEQLPKRVQKVFASLPEQPPEPPPSLAWQLDPRRIEPRSLERISVTDFRNYLECPFRFYLRRILGIQAPPDSLIEMDARAFGKLAHSTLQAFNENSRMASESNADKIAAALKKELDAVYEQHYGSAPSVPLELQKLSLHERLCAAAETIADARTEGWTPVRSEWKFSKDAEPLHIGGIQLSGVIDQIEHQPSTDSYRIIDYKTSEKPDRPHNAHLKKLGRNESPEDFRPYTILDLEDATYRWVNLQLPLYLWVGQHHLARSTSVAYFNLPRASAETGIEAWPDLDEATLQSALRCAEGVVADIRAQRFWPPGKAYPDAALDAWLQPNVESVFHPEALAALQGGVEA